MSLLASMGPSTSPYFSISFAVAAIESALTCSFHCGSWIDSASFGGIFASSDRKVRNSSWLAPTYAAVSAIAFE